MIPIGQDDHTAVKTADALLNSFGSKNPGAIALLLLPPPGEQPTVLPGYRAAAAKFAEILTALEQGSSGSFPVGPVTTAIDFEHFPYATPAERRLIWWCIQGAREALLPLLGFVPIAKAPAILRAVLYFTDATERDRLGEYYGMQMLKLREQLCTRYQVHDYLQATSEAERKTHARRIIRALAQLETSKLAQYFVALGDIKLIHALAAQASLQDTEHVLNALTQPHNNTPNSVNEKTGFRLNATVQLLQQRQIILLQLREEITKPSPNLEPLVNDPTHGDFVIEHLANLSSSHNADRITAYIVTHPNREAEENNQLGQLALDQLTTSQPAAVTFNPTAEHVGFSNISQATSKSDVEHRLALLEKRFHPNASAITPKPDAEPQPKQLAAAPHTKVSVAATPLAAAETVTPRKAARPTNLADLIGLILFQLTTLGANNLPKELIDLRRAALQCHFAYQQALQTNTLTPSVENLLYSELAKKVCFTMIKLEPRLNFKKQSLPSTSFQYPILLTLYRCLTGEYSSCFPPLRQHLTPLTAMVGTAETLPITEQLPNPNTVFHALSPAEQQAVTQANNPYSQRRLSLAYRQAGAALGKLWSGGKPQPTNPRSVDHSTNRPPAFAVAT